MSEFQYYEFVAIDRPLDAAAQEALRAISTRATITPFRLVNTYEWGDFKGDPVVLMERWFDLHLYWSNWGSRRLMLRLPKDVLDPVDLRRFLPEVDNATLRTTATHLILDIASDDEDIEEDEDHEGSGWLAGIAGVRNELAGGDLRALYLLWLSALQDGLLDDDAVEPLPGIGPLTASLHCLADFLRLDPDVLSAAAETASGAGAPSAGAVRAAIASLPDTDKVALLIQVFENDTSAAMRLRRRLRDDLPAPGTGIPARTVRTLQNRVEEIRRDRLRAEAEAEVARHRKQKAKDEKQRRLRLDALSHRGEDAWREIDAEIERRNASGYAGACVLLLDLKALAARDGNGPTFDRRVAGLRAEHSRKPGLIRRIDEGGL